MLHLTHGVWPWIWFHVFLFAMLALDLGVFHRRKHVESLKEALGWTVFWILLSLGFAGILGIWSEELGLRAVSGGRTLSEGRTALEFLTAWLIEKSLSMDNIFVFLMVFQYFGVPAQYQHEVLFWGILGALVMRLLFIVVGLALLHHVEWVIYVFGAILLYSGIHMWRKQGEEVHPENNPVIRLLQRWLPVTREFEGSRFFVVRDGKRMATPLFATLVVIETTDILFAVDSVPAVLAVTNDEFIAYTSNAFAILGLRALYFALAGIMPLFKDLHYGLSFILIFVGAKMIASGLYDLPDWTTWVSLGVIFGTLVITVITSILRHRDERDGTPDEPAEGRVEGD
jgi:tellurite resistance protein TerC